jgi:predicted glycoside hydrolase/deacetylase ChbG (UPF0249 family)
LINGGQVNGRCHVVLCADDYAMSEGVSRGIRDLADAGRISATSVMANMPGWRDLAPALRPFEGRIGIGMHLTLTWGRPLGPMPEFASSGRLPDLAPLLRAVLLRRLPVSEIEAEIDRQLEAFAEAFGRDPDFVDGHQHVHALPGIRTALLRVLGQRGSPRPIWLRDPADTPSAIARRGAGVRKAAFLSVLTRGFGPAARGAGFRTNRGFAGFSDFGPGRDLGRDFAAYLTAPGPAHLVMCHPGYVDDGRGLDTVVEARRRELDYLGSDAFAGLLAARGMVLAPGLP